MRICALFLFLLLFTLNTAAQDISLADLPDLAPITADNAAQLTELARYGDGVFGNSLAWSPDGETLAVAGSLGVWLYDAHNFSAPPRLLEHEGWVQAVAWSPDGETLAAVADGVYLWNLDDNTVNRVAEGESALAFSPDGALLAIGHRYWDMGWYWAEVNLINVSTGETSGTMRSEGSSRITELSFSSDGSLIVAAYSSNGDWSGCSIDDPQGFQVWRIADVIEGQAIEPDDAVISAFMYGFDVAFSNDGTWIASGHGRLGITLENIQSGVVMNPIEHLLQDEELVEEFAYREPLLAAVTSQRDEYLFVFKLRFFDLDTGESVGDFDVERASDLAFSQDGRRLAVLERGALRLWDVSDVTAITELGRVASLATTDEILVQIYAEGMLFQYAEPKTDEWQTSEGHNIRAVYNADETLMAYRDITVGSIYLRDVATVLDLPLPFESVPNASVQDEIAFNLNNSRFAFGVWGWQGCGGGAIYDIYIWDITNGVAAATQLAAISSYEVLDLAFSPDGSVLAAATDDSIELWSDSGAPFANLTQHRGSVYSVMFSTDGTLLLSEGADGTVRLWGIPGGSTTLNGGRPIG